MSIADVERSHVILSELNATVEKEINRHLAAADEWFPHEYVPYSLGRTYSTELGGQGWEPGDSTIAPVSREALLVNLLTEDNLPGYHFSLRAALGDDSAWGFWVNRWTLEENRHGIVIRDYLHVTRALDPVVVERARVQHMQAGYSAAHGMDVLRGLAYVSIQELATRVSHRNTGKASGDPVCERLMARVAKDENLHMIFYRNVLDAAFDLDPDTTMRAVTDVVTSFEMPGHAIEGFLRKSVAIANAGIYDLRLHHDEVLMPVLRKWRVFQREGMSAEGEQARMELAAYLEGIDSAASRFEERRAERLARQAARR